jgi:RNA recognition motif-containing protein
MALGEEGTTMKIYVGNFPSSTTEQELQQTFESFGQVTSISIVKDSFCGWSRGFGFVEMPSEIEACMAIDCLNGKGLQGKKLYVNHALEW